MARRRFFVDAIRGGRAELRGLDARHLTRVLRAQPGQLYEITDSQCAYLAEISEAHGDSVLFRVLEPVLEPWWQSFPGPFLYYPGRRLVPAPLRAFVDFIKSSASSRD